MLRDRAKMSQRGAAVVGKVDVDVKLEVEGRQRWL